jgi:CNT family concentrative nucleoside transporter
VAAGEIARAFLGIAVFIGIAWLVSEQRRAFPLKPILVGVFSQFVLALFLTRVPAVTAFFGWLAKGVDRIQSSSEAGARFVFGYLSGGPQPFVPVEPALSSVVFAFRALPAILFVSALSALLWHWKILRWFVSGAAWLFGRLFGVSGPVGVSTSACIFIGMIEAPLLIRPVFPQLSRGEIFTIMVDGMSVLAGSMMILLGAMLASRVPNAFSHLLIAALISTPMAIGLSRAIVPSDSAATRAPVKLDNPYRSGLDAIAHGTLFAAKMAANIAALLIVFVGLVALIDQLLALLPHADAPLTLATIFGHLLAPVAWLMGIPSADLQTAGALLGTKIALNEIVAYGQLVALAPGALSDKGVLIMTYTLSSFANIGSVAILIGTLTSMAPDKSVEIVQLGFKALLAALLATCLTGTTVGILSSLLIGPY